MRFKTYLGLLCLGSLHPFRGGFSALCAKYLVSFLLVRVVQVLYKTVLIPPGHLETGFALSFVFDFDIR